MCLVGVGAAVSIFSRTSSFKSGARMVLIGLLAAAATFLVGRAAGVSVAG